MRKYKVFTWNIVAVAFVVLFCVGCSSLDRTDETSTDGEIGIVLEGIDVSDSVLEAAKKKVQNDFEIAQEDFPNYAYTNLRTESLDYNYTYENFEDMELVIYQMNYEFFSESPENIVFAGGMYKTEDGWIMPSYPNSNFLIFQKEDGELSFIESIMVNDAAPGSQLFTEDLQRVLMQSKSK